MEIKNLGNLSMYMAVQLENTENGFGIWIPLPATKAHFNDALMKIGGQSGNFIIKEYARKVPGTSLSMFYETPLAVVNHLASRFRKLTDDELLKLCAICDSDYYFHNLGQIIDYTYTSGNYTLLAGICDEEALGIYYIGNSQRLSIMG